MKSKLLIIFFILLAFTSKSQNYFENDACWTTYTVNIFTNMVEYKNQYFLSGDTLLNGKTYKKVVGRSPNNLQNPTYFAGSIREEAGKVFKQFTDYETQVVGEFLLYDFNVKVGDTIYSTATSGELSRKPVVTKIDTIELLTGQKRKRFFFSGASEWIEGIGCFGGLFSQTYEHATNGKIENLVCFKQNGTEYYKNNSLCSDGTCCDVLSGLETHKLSNPTVSLSPNPTNRFVRLDFSKSINRCKSIKLTDALGNTLQELTDEIANSDFEMDLTLYCSGLYFIVIEFEKNREIHKVIKL